MTTKELRITKNAELHSLIATLDPNTTLFAIRTKGLIEIFSSKRTFNKKAKQYPNAVQGEFTVYNFFYYRF